MIEVGSFRFNRALRSSLRHSLVMNGLEALSDRLVCGFRMCALGSARPGLDPLGTGTGHASGRSRLHRRNVRITPPSACTEQVP